MCWDPAEQGPHPIMAPKANRSFHNFNCETWQIVRAGLSLWGWRLMKLRYPEFELQLFRTQPGLEQDDQNHMEKQKPFNALELIGWGKHWVCCVRRLSAMSNCQVQSLDRTILPSDMDVLFWNIPKSFSSSLPADMNERIDLWDGGRPRSHRCLSPPLPMCVLVHPRNAYLRSLSGTLALCDTGLFV